MAGGDPSAKFAARLIRAGRNQAAKRVLLSNGLAPRTKATADALEVLHLNYNEPLRLPIPQGRQVHANAVDCIDEIYKAAGKSECTPDVFGWRDDFWADCKGDRTNPLAVQAGRLQEIMSTPKNLPVALSFIATAGALQALNKVSKEESSTRAENGEEVLVRPINQGVIFTRRLMSVATKDASACKAKRSLQPIQMGLGVSAGPEITALTALALFRAGCLVGKEDAVNGFNATKRQAILDGSAAIWPEGGDLLNFFYGHPSPAIFTYRDDEGKECIRFIEGVEGARQGDVAGSFTFDMAEHHFIFSNLAALYPECFMHALTDDLIPIFELPEDPTDTDGFERAYNRYAAFWHDYNRLANPIGLFLNTKKSELLLPPHAPRPLNIPRAGGMVLNPVYDGIIIGGLPVGTDDFILEASQAKVASLKTKIEKVKTLRDNDAHIAVRTIVQAVNSALCYWVRGTPTRLVLPAATKMQRMVEKALEYCLETAYVTQPEFSQERLRRGHTLASLPLRDGGWGLTPVTDVAAPAFLATLLAASHDHTFRHVRHWLSEDATWAYERVKGTLSPAGWHLAGRVLPDAPEQLVEGDFALNLSINKHSRFKVQATLVQLLQKETKDSLRTTMAEVDDLLNYRNCSKEDATHIMALTAKSQMSRAMASNLGNPKNRILNRYFIPTARMVLGWPQQLMWLPASREDGTDCEVSICRRCNLPLGPTGKHAASCKSGAAARYAMHTELALTVVHHATSIGIEANHEPSTSAVLLHEVAPDVCRVIFAKNADQLAKDASAAVEKNLNLIQSAVSIETRTALSDEIDEILASVPSSIKARRIDVQLKGPDGKELWVDVGTTNLTKITTTTSCFKFFKKEVTSGVASTLMSPAVRLRVTAKHKHYKPILQMAQQQARRRDRASAPDFAACIVSQTGEFSHDFFATIEWLAMYKFREVANGLQLDGIAPGRATAIFRNDMKDQIISAVWKGVGSMLLSAGLPAAGSAAPRRDVFYSH